jgi:transposase
MPHKVNAACRHPIPRQKRRVTNWAEHDASLRQRGSLTIWFSEEAIKSWRAAPRTTPGDLTPDKRGGKLRSRRIDERRDFLLPLIPAEPGLTLAEVAERLDAATGYRPLPSVVCRFFQRHGVTRKKRRRMPPNGTGQTSGAPFATPSTPSHPRIPDPASPPLDTNQNDRNPLQATPSPCITRHSGLCCD